MLEQAQTQIDAESETDIDEEALEARIVKRWFPADKLEAAQETISEYVGIAEQLGLPVKLNFDPDDEFPDGYGVMVGRVNKRTGNGDTVIAAIAIAALPEMSTVESVDGGAEFIREKITDTFWAKFQSAVRPKSNGQTAASVPLSVHDFITSARPEGEYTGYNEVAQGFVKVLKAKGLKYLTKSLLRQCLESSAFAQQQYPAVPQQTWVAIIERMIAAAEKAGKPVGAMSQWLETRDSVEIDTGALDLEGLDFDSLLSES